MSSPEPGWLPDPEHPATLLRYWDGTQWTDETRPTGYVVQPAGPQPVAGAPGAAPPVFGATPPETGGPPAARRRLLAAQVAVVVTVLVAVVAVALLLTGGR